MQTRSDSPDWHAKRHHYLGKITTYALLCFALSGLIIGFAIGGFAGHRSTTTLVSSHTPEVRTPSIAQRITTTATATPVPENILPANPIIGSDDYTSPQKADGSTDYKLSASIMNKVTNKPVEVSTVTCRLWLTRDAQGTQQALSANNYALPKAINALDQPFPQEEAGAMEFHHSSKQVQPCSANKKTTWAYTLSPELRRGTYYLVVLADWKGKHYNWYMVQITITQENRGKD